MGERFRLNEKALLAALARGANDGFAPIGTLDGTTELAVLVANLLADGIIEAPSGLAMSLYVEGEFDSDAVAVSVWSRRCPAADVIAAVEGLAGMAPRELWEGEDDVARTLEIVGFVAAQASRGVAAVRLLEEQSERAFGTAVSESGAI